MQNLVAALLVAACFVYAVVSLMPAAWRRALAQRLLRWRLPAQVQRLVLKAAQAPAGCGCDGCDRPPALSTQDGAQPVRLHPRRPRP